MEPVEQIYTEKTSDENIGKKIQIKEEIPTRNISTVSSPEIYLPEKVSENCDAERKFTVKLNGRQHLVKGRLSDNVLSALGSTRTVSDWMAKQTGGEFHVIDTFSCCFNLGMPLKHVPQDSCFEIKFYKKEKTDSDELCYRPYASREEEECVLFYVKPSSFRMETGGAQSRRIIKCKKLFKECCKLCVFGPKGESIRDAVCNDGRFLPLLKETHWELIKDMTNIDQDFLVEDTAIVSREVFEIWVKSERGAKRVGHPDGKQKAVASREGQFNPLQKKERKQLRPLQEKRVTGECCTLQKQQQMGLLKRVNPQFQLLDLYPNLKKQKHLIDSYSRNNPDNSEDGMEVYQRDFGKVINDSLSIKLLKILAGHTESVGYIEWGAPVKEGSATCFVLRDSYILTCHHVVRLIVGSEEKDWGKKIKQSARVTFSFEESHPSANDWFGLADWFEIADKELDFAVLRLEETGSKRLLPPGLLNSTSFLPPNGAIFIIGHPSGGTKSMDGCLVVSIFERIQESATRLKQGQETECNNFQCGYNPTDRKCIHMYNPSFSEIANNPHVVTYDTCFFSGSSGSPVFDKRGYLVGLHAAGYLYERAGQEHSIIEYGYSIQSILSNIECKFKYWYEHVIFPVFSSHFHAEENISCVDTSLNEKVVEMDID